uniref:Steroid dehydrogenase n=1 Tax=Anopheles minimus TaxID=112268 RepID=A0A182W9U6_9DIPT
MFCSVLTWIGLYAGAVWLYENLRTPVLLLLQSLKQLVFRQKLSQRYGKWAVITGASDGIGKGYAHYLARQGMAIVLVARNEAKLNKVADEIKAKYGVETKVVVADFSKGREIYPHLQKALVPLDIGILVNNVGVSHDTPKYVDEVSQDALWDLINVNVAAATLLCNILAPPMKQRQRGLIVNVSSIASVSPSPCLTTYAASKAYMTYFSAAITCNVKMFCSVLTWIGLYAGAVWLYENLRTPVLLLLQSLKQLVFRQKLSRRYGKWAVITGASDGIGKGYAHYLARQGMAIVLVARNEAKLNKVADEIKAKYGVETKVVVADFSKGREIYPHLQKALVPLDIGILVNNVGVSHDTPKYVDEVSQDALWDLINVNVAAATLLCNILAPPMKQRQRGLIVNVSSIASVSPSPCLTTYAASKAYMTYFSVGLQKELSPFGVEVQTVRPSFVHTNMTDFLIKDMKNAQFKDYLVNVDSFMAYAGCTIGKVDLTSGHWSHGLQTAGLYLLPEFLRVFILGLVNKKIRDDFHVQRKKKDELPLTE